MTISSEPERAAAPAQPISRWWVLTAVECGNFVVYMDGFIVTLALPSMARHFGVGIHEIKWVLVAYLAALTITLLLAGRMSDRWGRKRITVIGAVLLAVGAILCALAPTLSSLIAFRIVQGLGGAMVLANVMAEITAVFPREERRRAMAVNASVLAMGQITGLVLGGFLIESLGWRSIFILIGAIGGLGVMLDLLVLRNHAATTNESLDWRGAALSILVVGAPFMLVERLSHHLLDPIGITVLLGSVVFLGLFVAAERKAAWPLLDLRLFRYKPFTFGSVAAAFYFIAATFGYVLMPLYAQIVLGLSPFSAGLLLVPMSLSLTITSQLVGHLSHRFGAQWSRWLSARIVSTAGLLCVSAAVFGMSLLGSHPPYAYVICLLVLAGAGGGLFHPPNNVSVLGGVPAKDLGAANGFFTTARSFGQAIGAALAASLLGHGLQALGALHVLTERPGTAIGSHTLDIYLQAQTFAFCTGAALGLVGAVLSALRGKEADAGPAAVATAGTAGSGEK
ncbi:MAG: MFS transporter [Planctomycetia bacterium]|nr:MFS transporter [Planctomycetia bacterium]